jgi:hypothetical protein
MKQVVNTLTGVPSSAPVVGPEHAAPEELLRQMCAA